MIDTIFSKEVVSNIVNDDEYYKFNVSLADRLRIIAKINQLWGSFKESDFDTYPFDRERYVNDLVKCYLVDDHHSVYEFEGIADTKILELNADRLDKKNYDFGNRNIDELKTIDKDIKEALQKVDKIKPIDEPSL